MDNFNLLLNSEKIITDSKNIMIEDFSVSINSKILFKNTNLKIQEKNIYGLIANNGKGKTTLLKLLYHRNFPLDSKMRVLYLEQEIKPTEDKPMDYLLKSNLERERILKEMKEKDIYLEEYNHYLQDEAKVNKILNGLGFKEHLLELPINKLSGGWLMRISLARCLYLEPELLLLDEPTNHLDIETIEWLEEYLETWKGSIIIVSHDIGFLNNVVSNIISIENHKLEYYKGNYNTYLKNYQKKLLNQINDWEKVEKTVKQMKKEGKAKKDIEEFLKKKEEKGIIKVEKGKELKFELMEIENTEGNLIEINNLSFGYNDLLIENLNLILGNEKIVIMGKNGSGKSTLLNLIMNNEKVYLNPKLRIGYYHQKTSDYLPLDKNPIEYLTEKNLIIKNDNNYYRKILAQLGLDGKLHYNLIETLSGGEKSRISLAEIILSKPNYLFLDEPTNHLDIDFIEVLIKGLKSFNGGIILITHDRYIIEELELKKYYLQNKTLYQDYN